MKLRNKKTGEIKPAEAREDGIYLYDETTEQWYKYELDLLAKWWEYYEEPKKYWYICTSSHNEIVNVEIDKNTDLQAVKEDKQIGNYFETKEEAELAVRKLKAWKRLKDAGFEFGGWTHTPITKTLTGYNLHIKAYSDKLADYMDDLQLLFGGEE